MKMKKFLTVVAGMSMAAMVLAGCGGNDQGTTAPETEIAEAVTEGAAEVVSGAAEAVSEGAAEVAEGAASAAADEMISDEENNELVQATLTYMGGLYVNSNPDNDMELAIFRNEEGDIIYIIYELGSYEYGMYTTEDAKLDDGRTYEKIIVNDEKTYGYYFADNLEEGILISTNGEVYDALALDESVARDLVRTTIVGE
jgi:hypothetical protein